MYEVYIQADQKHKTTLGEISSGTRSGMMANKFATLRKQVCVSTFIWDFWYSDVDWKKPK